MESKLIIGDCPIETPMFSGFPSFSRWMTPEGSLQTSLAQLGPGKVGPQTGWLCPNDDCTPCDMYKLPDYNTAPRPASELLSGCWGISEGKGPGADGLWFCGLLTYHDIP